MKSMIAFTQGRHVDPGFSLSVSIRSASHRQVDLSLRGSGITPATERMIRQQIGPLLRRGRVEVVFDLFLNDARHWEVQFNDYLAGEILRRLGPALKPHRDMIRMDADALLRIPMLFHLDPLPEAMGEDTLERISRFFSQTLTEWDEQRKGEGGDLTREMQALVERSLLSWRAHEKEASLAEKAMLERAKARVSQLLHKGNQGNEESLARELVLLGEKNSVTEELRRLGICLNRLGVLLAEPEALGREGDYLVQDIQRDLQVLSARLFEPEPLSLIGSLRKDTEQLRQLLSCVE